MWFNLKANDGNDLAIFTCGDPMRPKDLEEDKSHIKWNFILPFLFFFKENTSAKLKQAPYLESLGSKLTQTVQVLEEIAQLQ